MKLKLDENLGRRCLDILIKAGHDVATVIDQKMTSATDKRLIEKCKSEKRCIITLDIDFGNPLIFNPLDYAGIALIRLPSKPMYDDLLSAIKTLIGGLAKENINRKLWVIQRGKIRVYQQEDE